MMKKVLYGLFRQDKQPALPGPEKSWPFIRYSRINLFYNIDFERNDLQLIQTSIIQYLAGEGFEFKPAGENLWVFESEHGKNTLDTSGFLEAESPWVKLCVAYTSEDQLLKINTQDAIEYFFKNDTDRFYYIQTLIGKDPKAIEQNRGELNVVSIRSLLRKPQNITPPGFLEVLHTPEPSEWEDHFYIGYKKDFKGINDFWLSAKLSVCLWSYSISGDAEYYQKETQNQYKPYLLGWCIPSRHKYASWCLFLQTLNPALKEDNLIECYEMINQTSVVFDFKDEYVILDVIY